jgi:hypothetical protein
LSNGLGFKRLALALEIDSKRCYYKGSHLARPRSNITKKEGEDNEEEVPRIRVGWYLALHIGDPGICETPSS